MRTLAVSDDLPFLARVSALLSQQPGIEVVGRAGTGWEGLKLSAQLDCHLVVTDCTLPDMTGAAMVLALKKSMRPPLVVILSRHPGPEYLALAANAGADGYLMRDDFASLPSVLRRIDPAWASSADPNRNPTLFGRKRKPLLKGRDLPLISTGTSHPVARQPPKRTV